MRNMSIITLLCSAVLIILIFVQMHNSMRIEERRQELEELMDKSNHVISKFDSVFKDMEGTNRSYEAVIKRISELRKENDSLSTKNQSLLRENECLDWQNKDLKSYNRELTQKNQSLKEKKSQYEKAIENYQIESTGLTDSIESLKSIKVGFEAYFKGLPLTKLDFLSNELSSLGLKKSLSQKLKDSGIIKVGDLVRISEPVLTYYINLKAKSIDSIKSALETNNLHLNMNVVCVNGSWCQYEPENIEE